MKQLRKTITKLSVVILVFALWGCTEVESLLPTVTADFTFTNVEGSGTVKFINTSEDATKYEWDFGDGTTSTEINPIKMYAATATYAVKLKAINTAGASDTVEKDITVEVPVVVVDPDCTEETEQSLDAADFNLTFETDPGDAIVEDGGTYSYIDNPDTDNDVNESCKVGQIDRDAGLPFANNQILFDAKFDFNANAGFKLKVWAPAVGTNVLLKLEDKADSGINTEVAAATTVANAWEELTFAFDAAESGKYDKIVLFFDINTDSGATYYIDDFTLYEAGAATCTAETEQSLDAADLNITFQTDPGALIESYDAGYSYVANPDFDNAVNPSCQVGQIDRVGSALFANNQLVFDSKFDFNTYDGFKLKVWAPTAGTNVLLKLEDKTDSGINTEIGAVTTVASAWEELTFDFDASEAGKYDRIILFFELNTNTTATYYIDDLALYSAGGGATCTAETEQSLDATDLNITFQTDPGALIESYDAGYSYVANPDFDNAVNPSCQVGQIDRVGSALFANNQLVFDSKFDFNTYAGFKLKVWAPTAGTNVLLKLEDKTNSGINTEIGAVTTVANAWEELTFDFDASEAGKYDRIILFFELNTNTTATYYIDDLSLYGTGGGGATCTAETEQSLDATDLNITFQTDPGALIESYDAAYSYIANPDFDNAVNPSCQVGQIDRNGAALFANNQLVFNSKFDFNANSGFKLKVWAPTAGTNVLLKLEDKTNSGINTEIGAVTTVANAWEELTFDFDAAESGKYDRIILFFELNTNTTATYYIDDFRLYGTGSGGATCTPETSQSLDATDLDITFQTDPGALIESYDAAYSYIANPDFDNAVNPSCQVGQIDRNGGALFANNQLVFNSKFDFNANSGFKLKVWAPTVGTNVLLKLEDKTNSGINTEIGAVTTVANAWEELTFDFDAAESGKYDRIILFFELNTNTTATYYIDDFRLYGSGSGGTGSELATNGDFETGDDTGWFIFQNGGTAALDNTISNGGTWSGKLTVGDTGGNPAFKQERIGAGTVAAGDVVQVQFDHIGTIVQPGAAVNVILFGEGAGGVSFTEVLTPGPVLGGSWDTYTGTYTIPPGTDVSEGISFLIETVCGAVAGCSVTMNIDNVSVTLNP